MRPPYVAASAAWIFLVVVPWVPTVQVGRDIPAAEAGDVEFHGPLRGGPIDRAEDAEPQDDHHRFADVEL